MTWITTEQKAALSHASLMEALKAAKKNSKMTGKPWNVFCVSNYPFEASWRVSEGNDFWEAPGEKLICIGVTA
jgi:hypothetical protein